MGGGRTTKAGNAPHNHPAWQRDCGQSTGKMLGTFKGLWPELSFNPLLTFWTRT